MKQYLFFLAFFPNFLKDFCPFVHTSLQVCIIVLIQFNMVTIQINMVTIQINMVIIQINMGTIQINMVIIQINMVTIQKPSCQKVNKKNTYKTKKMNMGMKIFMILLHF